MKTTILSQESASPLYKQLMTRLRRDIADGVYPIHSRIPSEQQLCDTYQVSRVTVRKALADLTQEGLLIRQQGKGTFVSLPRIQKNLREINSFHSACRMLGCTAGTRLIHRQVTPPTEEDAFLNLQEGEQVIEISRLRLADDLPVMLEINRFPGRYDFLLKGDLSGSLYSLMEAHGLEASQATHDISLCYASAQQAKLLELAPGDALLQLDEMIFDQHGQPLHLSHQVIRGDRFTFRI